MEIKEQQMPSYEELSRRVRELEERLRIRGNTEYKSRLFSFIFGREENKEWTLSLYNSISRTNHKDPSDITINTIEDVVYLGMRNDLSILVSDTVTLYRSMGVYEQQSSFNPNMPIRGLMYAGKLYDKFLYTSNLNRFGKKLIPLPVPKLVVFYNGTDEKDDDTILELSDAFREEIRRTLRARGKKPGNDGFEEEVERIYRESSPDISIRVRMINVNYGHSRKILSACKPLEEYAWLVARIREYAGRHKKKTDMNDCSAENDGLEIGIAIDKAIDDMPENFPDQGISPGTQSGGERHVPYRI